MARDAVNFTAGMSKGDFISNNMCHYAVIRCLEVIGEAAKKVSQDFRDQYTDIPWSQMARMRDLLIHAYARVDLDEVWATLQNDLPGLIIQLEKIVPPEERG